LSKASREAAAQTCLGQVSGVFQLHAWRNGWPLKAAHRRSGLAVGRGWDREWNWDLFQPLALSQGSFVDGSMKYQDGPGVAKGNLTGLFLQPW